MKEELSNSNHSAIHWLSKKLETLDTKFKVYLLAVINLIEDKVTLEEELAILDHHDDRVANLLNRFQQLGSEPVAVYSLSPTTDPYLHLCKQCATYKGAEISQGS